MAREQIDKATVRNKLAPRREPYWGAPVERGLYVGFRKAELNGSWVARFRNEDGKQVYQSLGPVSTANDYEAAKRDAVRWAKGVQLGVSDCEVETVADACLDYVEGLKRDNRPGAASDAMERFNRTVLNDPLGKIKLSHLRERHLEAWKDRLTDGTFTPVPVKGARKVKPITPPVYKRTLTTLKAALNRAVRKRYVAPDRALEWQEMRPDKDADGRRDLYLTKEQRRDLLDAAEGNVRDIIECVALTGCRPGDPSLTLRKHYDARTGSVTFMTKGHVRTIPVSPKANALLARLANGKLPTAHLFVQEDGNPWTARDWHDPVRAAVAKAGLPPATVLYTLRHSWITDAIVGGMDLLTVAKLVGTSLAMIEKHYGHLVHGAARDKLARLEFL